MNSKVATQLVLAVLRHAMTGGSVLGVAVSDDWVMTTASLLVGVLGLGWSFVRKFNKE